jgi:LuxR family maltose regulon positive regulatory protein
MPEQVHLAIASRTDPPLAMDRLRAGRVLAEIRARDLRFSEGETEAYLAMALGPELARELAALLERRTEGWIVGLHLAALWLRGTDNPAEFLAGFGGDTSQFVAAYLATEVLTHQPAKVRQFLLQTSILNRLCAELCDVVVGLPPGSSSAVLDELDRANLFLMSLGETGGWYRYHHLFEEMLQATLHSQASPDEIAALHCRAGKWFAAQGQIEDALHHALAAGDVESAVQLVEGNAHNLLNRLERHTLERWLALLPREVVWQRPRLLVAQAWLLYRQSRISALDAVLDAAEACLNRGADCVATVDEQSVWGQVHALRSATAYLIREDFERSLASAERALAWLPLTERGARSTALGYWALARQAMGQKAAAIHRLEEALSDPAPHDLAGTQVFLGLCLSHYIAGELQRMLGATRRFLALAAELKQANAIVGSNWLSGLVQYESNDLAAADLHFSRVFQLRYRSNFVATFNSTIGLARIHQVWGELEKAQEMLEGLRTETLRLDNTDFLSLLDSFQAYQWLLQGDIASALRWARTLDSGDLIESPFWFEVPSLTQARLLIAAGTDEEVREVRRSLQDKLAAARRRYNVQRAIQILAHLTLAHDRLGEVEQGLVALEEALTLAEPGGSIRSFVDTGPQLRALLLQMKQPCVNPHYLAEILAAFDAAPQDDALSFPWHRSVQLGTDPALLLTRREEEILQLMHDGLTNKEIASDLVISVHTVKRHATNIYHKLDADGRRQAIHKAQQLGILPAS